MGERFETMYDPDSIKDIDGDTEEFSSEKYSTPSDTIEQIRKKERSDRISEALNDPEETKILYEEYLKDPRISKETITKVTEALQSRGITLYGALTWLAQEAGDIKSIDIKAKSSM